MEDTDNIEPNENRSPHIGMEFDSIDQAWSYWMKYGGRMGFSVRQKYNNTDKNNVVTSSRFVCSKEGFRKVDIKRDHLIKNPRPEQRMGCNVRLGIVLDRKDGKYKVQDFVSEHNHTLLMPPQRKITETQADACGIKPRVAHDRYHNDYLRSKSQRVLEYGEAGSLLKYFHQQTLENPYFQYSIQLDSEEQITNIFWADAKMLVDYSLFGDVIVFETTFGTNKENRPLGVFLGFNHFREVVVFGVGLLYDETVESFKWLFETFIASHDNKTPKTIFTDQDIAMGEAIAEVLPDTWHGLCTWHIMQNAKKHLIHDGSNVLQQFKACMYDYSDEVRFEEAFTTLRSSVTKSAWLEGIYTVKEKWAECHMTNVFSLGMRRIQLSESFNKDLKDYLRRNLDIMCFLKQFERVIEQKRENEIISEYESRDKLPRIKLRRSPLLRQASQVYTTKMFEAFQDEYEWSTAAYVNPCGEGLLNKEYTVSISDIENDETPNIEYRVLGDISTQTVSCSCKMFERLGILCAHALKVLDTMNIKLLPEKYILKRWTREARSGTVKDVGGEAILEDAQLDATRRFRYLCRKFVKIASRASTFKESFRVLDIGLDNNVIDVEKIFSSIKPENGSVSGAEFPHQNIGLEHGSPPGCSNLNGVDGCPNFNGVTLEKKDNPTGGRRRKISTESFRKENVEKRCKSVNNVLNDEAQARGAQNDQALVSHTQQSTTTFTDLLQDVNTPLTLDNSSEDISDHTSGK